MPRPKKEQPNHAGGLYEVKITVGKTMEGKLIRKSFYSSISKEDARKQAEEWKVEREVANRTGNIFVEKDVAFGEWASRWAESYKKPRVDENTYITSYLNPIKKHIVPYFGQALLKDIRPVDIMNFYNSKKELSESTLKKIRMCLNGIFESAIENDLCQRNPVKNQAIKSEKKKSEKRVYTDQQIEAVEEYADSKMPEVIILLETGLRRGELLGLTWDDIDFTEQTISVKRSIADQKGGGIKINSPKWNSYRTNPLSQKAFKTFQKLPHFGQYIFSTKDGNPQSPNTWSQKLERFIILPSMQDESLPKLTAHELRHTYGTKLRRDGVDIYTIQKIMGHKDIKITTEIYVHNEIEVLRKAMENSL